MKQLFLSMAMILIFSVVYSQKTPHYDQKPYVDGEFLIQLNAGTSAKEVLQKLPPSYGVQLVKELSKPMRIWKITFDPNAVSASELQRQLLLLPQISEADYNYHIQMRSTLPSDPSISQQWHHNNTGQTGGTSDADIDSDLAWDITTGGSTATNDDIVIALIESGNLDHQDLTGNRWFNPDEIENNNIDDDGNGYIDDYHGWNPIQNNDNYGTGSHGTNCLGMMGAKGNNNLNVVGANWNVKLMVIGDYSISTQADAIEAYTYPLIMRQRWNNSNGTEGAFVVATSSSWGIDGANPNNYPLWCAFYDTLGKYGIINVGATTNSNLDVDVQGDMPTACNSPYMLGVGRTDHNDNTAGGFGDQTIEFGAPGINVVTTSGTTGITTTTGTSFSCPLTAGVVALAYSIPCTDFMTIVKNDPQQGADLVLDALMNGTDPKSQLATKFISGGRLNARNTLDELMGVACTGAPLCLTPSALATGSLTDTSGTVSFTAYSSATASLLYYREVGSTQFTFAGAVSAPYVLDGLTDCTEYEIMMRSVCGTDTSGNTGVITFRTTNCGNCIDLPYCTSGATDGQDEWINTFTLNGVTHTSGNDGGFADHGAVLGASLQQGATYPIAIDVAWASTQYNEYSRIWVDVNQNGTFETTEKLYDQGAASQTDPSGTIAIPANAVLGETKLRVQMAYQGQGQTSLPAICGDFTYGEVEDYCITIVAGSGASLNELNWSALVYPNPANSSFTVQQAHGVSKVHLRDLNGKNLRTQTFVNGQTEVQTQDLASGMYVLIFEDDLGVKGQYRIQIIH
jgi:hypothetical protein